MYRKILSWAFLILGTLLLILSVAGIAAIWIYRLPARDQAISRLKQVDSEMTQAETALDNGKAEIERTLRIVDAAEKSLDALKTQLTEAKILTDKANGTLNSSILPGLQSTRDKINQLRGTLPTSIVVHTTNGRRGTTFAAEVHVTSLAGVDLSGAMTWRWPLRIEVHAWSMGVGRNQPWNPSPYSLRRFPPSASTSEGMRPRFSPPR